MLEQLAIQQNQMQDRILGLQSEIQKLEISLQAKNNDQGSNRGTQPMSDEPLGIVVPTVEPEREPEPIYHCNDCKQPITYGQGRCGNCRADLNWEGL